MWRHFAGRDFPLEGFCERLFPAEGFGLGGISPHSLIEYPLTHCAFKRDYHVDPIKNLISGFFFNGILVEVL